MTDKEKIERAMNEIQDKIDNIDFSDKTLEKLSDEFGTPVSVTAARIIELQLQEVLIILNT